MLPALDIGDAFLAVDLQQPKILTGELASDDVEEFALGKVLQRECFHAQMFRQKGRKDARA